MSKALELAGELLQYDKKTGVFRWKSGRAQVRAGDIAGSMDNHGYIKLRLNGMFFKAHRIAWMMAYREAPKGQIDHINGIRSDNRIENLRVVTNKQNAENMKLRSDNTSGFRGVSFNRKAGRYEAHVRHLGKKLNLGIFDTKEEASAIARMAREKLFTHERRSQNDVPRTD